MMKHPLWAVCAAIFGAFGLSSSASAAIIASDSFLTTSNGAGGTYNSVANSGRLHGQNPTAGNTGFSGGWGSANNSATGDLRAELGGLSHPNLVNPAVADDGNAFTAGGTAIRTITRPLDVFSHTESQYFMSALMWVGTVPAVTDPATIGFSGAFDVGVVQTNGLQIGIDDGRIRLYHRDESGTYLSAGTEVYGSVQADVVYQLVVQIEVDVDVDDNERFTVDVYDDSGNSVLGSPFSILGTLNVAGAEFDYLALHKRDITAYGGTTSSPRFDEFRFATTLADVTTVPEPSSLLLAFGCLIPFAYLRRRSA